MSLDLPGSGASAGIAPALRFVSCSGVTVCRASAGDDHLLGGAFFGLPLHTDFHDMPVASVPVPVLAGAATEGEVWAGHGPTVDGYDEASGLRYRHDGQFLFGVVGLAEADFSGAESPLRAATEAAYRAVFATMDRLGYPHLIRCWNYLADINGDLNGLERYRHFNIGRQDAFVGARRETVGSVPAACALGTRDGDLQVFFLAAHVPAIAIENPRQVSAFRYPQQYGPRSPTFARAALLPLGPTAMLLVSGTASIIGHETVHPGDVRAQVRETLANIATVVDKASQGHGYAFRLPELDYRIYVRHAADCEAVRQEFAAGFPANEAPHAVYMQADVCRSDLLVEIEATGYAVD